jgi:4-amino-4-deoxy-L-arabinose transferase-like glycosyltransferase
MNDRAPQKTAHGNPLRNLTGSRRILWLICVVASAVLLGIRFIHLNADFPYAVNNSADIYTDEGWWSNSAILRHQTGEWLREGDFNPIVYLPLLPLVQSVSFGLFGVSLTSARLIPAIMSVLACLLVAFSRLALLELPMTCLVLLSLFLASDRRRPGLLVAGLASLAFALAILMKTTALFALPALVIVIWSRQESRKKGLAVSLLTLAGIALTAGAYYLAMGIAHGEDLAWLWRNTALKAHENALTTDTLTLKALYGAVIRVMRNALLLDRFLILAVLILAPLVWLVFRSEREDPLYPACGSWIVVTLTALAVRGYLPLRYYTPLLFPLIILLGCAAVFLARRMRSSPARWLPAFVLAGFVLWNGASVCGYLASPQYSYQSMADDVEGRIRSGGETEPLILGSVANTVSLATDIPSLNTDMGVRDLAWKLEQFRPNYYVSLGESDGVMEIIGEQYSVNLLATYDVFDNFRMGMRFYLYKLGPKQ